MIRESASLLRLNALATFIPLLIAVRLRRPQDGDGYLRVLELCERYAFRVFRLAHRRANAGESTLFKLAHDLYHGTADLDAVTASLRGTLHYYNPESRFHDAFDVDPDEPGDWYSWSGLKYFLYEYRSTSAASTATNRSGSPGTKSKAQHAKRPSSTFTPQTPTDPYWKQRFSDSDATVYLNDLGNLCLTKDNDWYSNKSFDEKKGAPGQQTPCYADAGLRQERELWQ